MLSLMLFFDTFILEKLAWTVTDEGDDPASGGAACAAVTEGADCFWAAFSTPNATLEALFDETYSNQPIECTKDGTLVSPMLNNSTGPTGGNVAMECYKFAPQVTNTPDMYTEHITERLCISKRMALHCRSAEHFPAPATDIMTLFLCHTH